MYSHKIFYDRLKKLANSLEKDLSQVGFSNDPETIHRVRVSSRRIRSILSLYRLPRELTAPLREIGSHLGALRDIEVEMDFIRSSSLSPEIKGILLKKKSLQREVMRVELTNRNPSFDSHKFLGDIKRYIKKKPLDERRIFRKLLNTAERVSSHAAKGELHSLRISIKKMRYTIEALGLAHKVYLGSIDDFKRYQDILGVIHDLEVWRNKSVLDPALREYTDLLWDALKEEKSSWKSVASEIFTPISRVLSFFLESMGSSSPSWDFLLYPSASEKEDSCLTLGEALSPDWKHPQRVAEKCRIIFQTLRDPFRLAQRDLAVLTWGALLHDIGHSSMRDIEHHLESQRLITTSGSLLLSPVEREMVAVLARNHRKRPTYESRPLSKKEIKTLHILSGILRCADGMEFESYEYIDDFSLILREDILYFSFDPPSTELVDRFLKKSRYLSKVLGLEIRISSPGIS